MANGPTETILARISDCLLIAGKITDDLTHAGMVAALSDVRTQLQDALRAPGIDADAALSKALAWLDKGVDAEVWNTMRALAEEVQRLRPLAEASTALADRERAFAKNCERVMAGMEVEVAALSKARTEAAKEVERLTSGVRRIATDYDFSPAGKVAKQILGEAL